jgi:hypothetical protein
MRSNVIYSFAAVFAAFVLFSAVSAAFSSPVPALADQLEAATTAVTLAQEQSARGVQELTVEARRPL